jgi:hypothetical protein
MLGNRSCPAPLLPSGFSISMYFTPSCNQSEPALPDNQVFSCSQNCRVRATALHIRVLAIWCRREKLIALRQRSRTVLCANVSNGTVAGCSGLTIPVKQPC